MRKMRTIRLYTTKLNTRCLQINNYIKIAIFGEVTAKPIVSD